MEASTSSSPGEAGRLPGRWVDWVLLVLVTAALPAAELADGAELGNPNFIAVRFEVEPVDSYGMKGRPLLFDCVVTSSVPAEIYWLKDGTVFKYDSRRYKLQNGSLYFESIEQSRSDRPDEGSYQCAASLAASRGIVVSRRARLHVSDAVEASFTVHPQSATVRLGDVTMISCRLSVLPSVNSRYNITWLLNDKRLQDLSGDRFVLHRSGPESVLELQGVGATDLGSYACQARLANQFVTSDAAVIGQSADSNTNQGVIPRFVMTPTSQAAVEGDTVLLLCGANGRDRNGAMPMLTWLKDGATINLGETERVLKLEGQGSLRIEDVQEFDSGSYTCRATNLEDSIDADVFLKVQVAPKFLVAPRNVASATNTDAQLDCDVYASPAARVTWLKNGDEVIPSDYFQIVDGRNLRILGLMESDGGMYQCTASNDVGMIQASAQLIVLPKATVTPVYGAAVKDNFLLKTAANLLRDASMLRAPTRLTCSYVSDSLVSLSWEPPTTDGPSDAVLGYIVYWKESGMQRERSMNTTISEVNIQKLKPSATYTLRVTAYSERGLSSNAAEIIVTTQAEDAVPRAPTNLTVIAVSPTSLWVTWGAPPAAPPSEPLAHYKLYYHSAADAASEADVTVMVPSCALIGLLKFHAYTLRVVAYNRHGPSAGSEEITVRTYSDVPSAVPSGVTVEAVSSTSIVVGWEPPPENSQNGIITGYKVQYRPRKDRQITVTTDGSSRTLDLSDLQKGTEYNVRIQAQTVNGSGPFTSWISAETFLHDLDESTVPGKPTSLRVRPLINSIVVSWTPPVEQDIMIRGYVLGYGIGVPEVYRMILEPRMRYHTIKELRPLSQYVISLKAFNEVGEGNPIYETTTTREEMTQEPMTPMMPPVGLKAVVVSSTAIVLTWSDASLGRQQRVTDTRFYTVRYNPKVQRKYKLVNSTEFILQAEDLRADTEYEFCVKVTKGARQSTWSLSTFNRTEEAVPATAPRDLTPVSFGDSTSVTLNWQPPRLANGQITGYLVYFATDATTHDSEWIVDGVLGDRLSTTIRDLRSETTYYFKVQARNAVGTGPVSPTVIFRTPRADGTGGGLIETPDDYGRIIERPRNWPRGTTHISHDAMNNANLIGGIPPLYLWIGIGCVSGFVVVLVAIIVVVCCRQRRRNSRAQKQMDSLSRMKMKCGGQRDLKPPDLWIHHGNIEVSSEERDSDLETTSTIGRRHPRSPREICPPGFVEEERTHITPMRPLPVLIPVDASPPSGRDQDQLMAVNPALSQAAYQRPQYASAPRVNVSDLSTSNSMRSANQRVRSPAASTAPSFKLPTLSAPRLSSRIPPIMTHHSSDGSAHTTTTSLLPVLSGSLSTEELTEEMASLEGLMKDLDDITQEQQQFSD